MVLVETTLSHHDGHHNLQCVAERLNLHCNWVQSSFHNQLHVWSAGKDGRPNPQHPCHDGELLAGEGFAEEVRGQEEDSLSLAEEATNASEESSGCSHSVEVDERREGSGVESSGQFRQKLRLGEGRRYTYIMKMMCRETYHGRVEFCGVIEESK